MKPSIGAEFTSQAVTDASPNNYWYGFGCSWYHLYIFQDLSAFALPGLAEEEGEHKFENNNKDFRGRSGSAGLKKTLFSFKRSRSKSGEVPPITKDSAAISPVHADCPEKKGLRNLFRPRSHSESVNHDMIRHRNGSGSQAPCPVDTLNSADSVSPRNRSTSWGARDRLRRISGSGASGNPTPMSQLLSTGNTPVHRKLEKVRPISLELSRTDAQLHRPIPGGSGNTLHKQHMSLQVKKMDMEYRPMVGPSLPVQVTNRCCVLTNVATN